MTTERALRAVEGGKWKVASGRLRRRKARVFFNAKTQKEARQNPSETDFPRFLLHKSTASVFFNARNATLTNPITSDARKDAATQSLFPRKTDLRLPCRWGTLQGSRV